MCDNEVYAPSTAGDWDEVIGDAASSFSDISESCPALSSISLPAQAYSSGVIGGVDDLDDDYESTTTGTSVVSTDTDGAGGYAYVGCFSAGSGDLFDVVLEDDEDMTPLMCVQECQSFDERYAGLQSGSECWCGSPLDYSIYGDGTCNSACAGNPGMMCGGEASLSVYIVREESSMTSSSVVGGGVDDDDQGDDTGGLDGDENGSYTFDDDEATSTGSEPVTPTPGPVSSTPEPEDDDADSNGAVVAEVSGTYLGCYGDDDNYPILDFAYEDENSLTVQSCINHCEEEGEELAGLQMGRQCWCGTTDDYDMYGASSKCNMRCTGDSFSYCGGDNDSMVFEVSS